MSETCFGSLQINCLIHIFERKESKCNFLKAMPHGILNDKLQSKYMSLPYASLSSLYKMMNSMSFRLDAVDVNLGLCTMHPRVRCSSPPCLSSLVWTIGTVRELYLVEWLHVDPRTGFWNSNSSFTTYKQCHLIQVTYSHQSHCQSRDNDNVYLIGLLGGLSPWMCLRDLNSVWHTASTT